MNEIKLEREMSQNANFYVKFGDSIAIKLRQRKVAGKQYCRWQTVECSAEKETSSIKTM